MNKGIQCLERVEPSNSKAYCLFKLLKAFICNFFKGEQSGVNSAESRQSGVNRKQDDINAKNCRITPQFTHNSSLSTVHSHAFTLAETLIVMGIIGIVAALAIPNLNSSTSDAEKIAKFKKIYAELVQAHDRATAVYGPVETWPDKHIITNGVDSEGRPLPVTVVTSAIIYGERLVDNLKVNLECKCFERRCTTIRNCVGKEVFDGGRYTEDYHYGFILSSGTGVALDFDPIWCNRLGGCGFIFLNLDGPQKGKDTPGIDIFTLTIGKNGIIADGNDDGSACFADHSLCGRWIMDNGNMDYLKADSEGKCNNDPSKLLGYGDGKVQSCK